MATQPGADRRSGTPIPAASATSRASGAPVDSTAIAASSAAAALALASSTRVCPRRWTSCPSSGPPTPSAIPYTPVTTPAAANEPVNRCTWTTSPMPQGTSQLVIDKHRRIVVGATFTGSEVQDMLQAATFAVVGELTLEQLWHGIAPFPTRSEIWLNLPEATGL